MEYLSEYLNSLKEVLNNLPKDIIKRIIDILLNARKENNTIFILGNGGSAATASHFACDLAKGTISEGKKRFRNAQ